VFTVDRESGEIRFGDGLRGARPSAGAPIVVSYAYGGGPEGNVGIGAINTSPQLPAGFAVSNPLPTWAGTEGESVAEAERSIPRQLRERDRAVSATDMRDIARRTPGVALGRVEVLPLFHPDFGAPAPGVVTLLVVPDDPVHPEAPVPDRLFLAAVCEHLEPRRLLTTEVHVAGPEYVGLSVAVGIDVVPGEDVAPVREAVKGEIREFLSPLKGGQRQEGWPLEKAVEDRELWARAARVDGVAKVRDLKLWDATGAAVARIEITGLQLPKLDRISARFGDPEDLLAEPAVPPPVGGKTKRVPVPVLPPEC
jgi:predicted phage baseplate assembly protein